jgi:hypothetical protein
MAKATKIQEKKSRREVPACEILTKIEKGEPVEYDNVIIEGNLDIRKLNLLKEDKNVLIVSPIKIINSLIKGKLNFQNAVIFEQAFFDYTYFGGYSCFLGVQFRKGAWFNNAKFSDGAVFNEAKFDFQARFTEAKFLIGAVFNKTQFNSDVSFERALFIWDANFTEAQFNGDAHFWGTQFRKYALFDNAKFNKSAYFWKGSYFGYAQFFEAQFNGDVLTFKGAVFNDPMSQEEACRRAKNVLEKNGNREEAGYHFYREMDAKRKQKGISYEYFDYEALLFYNENDASPSELTDIHRYLRYNILEYLFIQVIFGYGVHPYRLWGFWWFIVSLFALLYWIGSGVNNSTTAQPLTNFLDYLWFSITVAVTPGFAGYKPVPGFYQVLAGVEAIFGTFMWAAFITTFAKKYMR